VFDLLRIIEQSAILRPNNITEISTSPTAAELCSLRWSQIDLRNGRMHVNRAKGGIESVHPSRWAAAAAAVGWRYAATQTTFQ
jgi:integrase